MALMLVRGRENPLKALIEGLGTGMKAREDSRIKREELKIKSDRNKALAALWLAKSKAGAGKMKDLTNAELIKLTESETTPDDISSKAQAILRERMGLPPRNPETLTAPNGAAKDETVAGANMSDAADGAKGGTFFNDTSGNGNKSILVGDFSISKHDKEFPVVREKSIKLPETGIDNGAF